jgi:hypothetical protein
VFKTVALAWHKNNKKWSQNTADRLLASMNNHIFPVIGHLSVTELKPHHFIDLLKGIEEKACWKSRPARGSTSVTSCAMRSIRDLSTPTRQQILMA